MTSEALSAEVLATLVTSALALQFAAFGWRILREIQLGDEGRRTWLSRYRLAGRARDRSAFSSRCRYRDQLFRQRRENDIQRLPRDRGASPEYGSTLSAIPQYGRAKYIEAGLDVP